MVTRTLAGLAAAILALAVTPAGARPAAAAGPVPVPTLSGPITGGIHGVPMGATPVPIAASGYTEKEYFFTGTARGSGGLGDAAYTSRMLVRRPADPARFNGTLVVEWYNVTDASDNDFDWHRYFPEILRDGYAFAAVSVQYAGVYPGLKAWDPVRYAPISHPGDGYAFDIWAQAVQGLRTPHGVNPLAGMAIQHVLGTGDSQSANQLSMYISQGTSAANHNVDGYLIDSGNSPTVAPDVPVIENATEGDVVLFGAKTKTSGPNYRLWSLAGASHVDHWELAQGRSVQTGLVTWDPVEAGQYGERGVPAANACNTVSDMFPGRYVWDASLVALNRWVATGLPPPASPLIALDGTGQVARDAYGNALGGLRLPPIDLPVATYTGGICVLYGTTQPLSPAQLAALYPSHQDYVNRMANAIAASVDGGWMLPADGIDLLQRACASDIGGPAASATCPPSYSLVGTGGGSGSGGGGSSSGGGNAAATTSGGSQSAVTSTPFSGAPGHPLPVPGVALLALGTAVALLGLVRRRRSWPRPPGPIDDERAERERRIRARPGSA